MSLQFSLIGGKGKNSTLSEAHVHPFKTATGLHHGLVVLTQRFVETEPITKFFTNPTNGIAMNKTITFGGARLRATILHAGVNSGSAITGTTDVTPQEDKLVDVSGGFDAVIGPGAVVHNTTAEPDEFAIVTNVDSDTLLSLDSDIMDGGSEDYVINDIWPGTAVQGTWNFADGGNFTITNALNNDEATFTVDSSHIWNASHFVSFTGKVDLDTYDPSTNKIVLEFGLDGVLVGNSVDIDDFIDTGNFDEQSFVIPIASFGLTAQNFNSMRLVITRSSGTKPDVEFDDFQWENTGTPLIYTLNIDREDRFHISELVFAYADVLAGTVTDGTMPGLAFNKILDLAALTNGFVITRLKEGKTIFSATIRTLGGHISAGAIPSNPWSDGTNTFITLRVVFPDPLILTGDPNDGLTIQINDSMSDLLQFTVAGRGSIESG